MGSKIIVIGHAYHILGMFNSNCARKLISQRQQNALTQWTFIVDFSERRPIQTMDNIALNISNMPIGITTQPLLITSKLSGKIRATSRKMVNYFHFYFSIFSEKFIFPNISDTFQLRLLHSDDATSDDITIKSTRSIKILDKLATVMEASANTVEDPLFQSKPASVSILYEKIPDSVQLLPNENEANFIWITIVQSSGTDIEDEFRKIHEHRNDLLAMHTNEWAKTWSEIQITAKGNTFLSNAIQASQFALVSSLPSLNRSKTMLRHFYGISPAGLGLDRKQEVYNGHSFWDTEIWMQPSILLFEPEWSQQLLNYRHLMRNTAHENAINTGYQGFRFVSIYCFTVD